MTNLIGSAPDQVSTNGMLGGMAFEDANNYAPTVGQRDLYANGSSGASKTINWANGALQSITLDANCTLSFDFAGCPTGGYRLIVLQDGTGGRSVTWSTNTPGSTKWLSINGSPTLRRDASSSTIIDIYWDKTNCYGVAHHVGGAAQKLAIEAEVIPAGQTGNKTINKPMGRVNIAAGMADLTVTNNLVTGNSIILATISTVDANFKSVSAVPGSGFFVLYPNVQPHAETSVSFLVLNGIDYD